MNEKPITVYWFTVLACGQKQPIKVATSSHLNTERKCA